MENDPTNEVGLQNEEDDGNVIIYEKMLALEREFMDFQESSKELEQALEQELKESEDKNILLTTQMRAKDAKIDELNNTVIDLSKEVNRLTNNAIEQRKQLEAQIADLKKKLVTVEILNEDVLSHDRIMENKLALATQFNNELLEKIALTENDLEMERQINAQNRLKIFNLENEKSLPPKSKRLLKQVKGRPLSVMSLADTSADGTVLDIEDFLASAPPGLTTNNNAEMPRSESKTKIHELTIWSGEMQQRIGELSNSLAMKAHPTREVSPYKVNSSAQKPSKDETHKLTHSPSVRNLAKFGTSSSAHQGTSKPVRLRTTSEKTVAPKNNKLRGMVKRFFA